MNEPRGYDVKLQKSESNGNHLKICNLGLNLLVTLLSAAFVFVQKLHLSHVRISLFPTFLLKHVQTRTYG